MRKVAIVIYGAPGSGKGAQSNLICNMLGAINLDTGKIIESIVHDRTRQKSKFIQRERKLWDSGKLNTPSWATTIIDREIRRMSKSGASIVLSGSPRTLYEAKRLFPVLEKLYGKQKVFAFELDVPDKVSLNRNVKRMVCSICKAPLLTSFYPSKNPVLCPICGGRLYKRVLDKSNIIKVRLKEYKERTEPIFSWFAARGRKIYKLDGRPAPYLVFAKIQAILGKKLK